MILNFNNLNLDKNDVEDIKASIVCQLINETALNASILYTVLRKYPMHSIKTAIKQIEKE